MKVYANIKEETIMHNLLFTIPRECLKHDWNWHNEKNRIDPIKISKYYIHRYSTLY